MAMRKTGARPIVVDGVVYHWRIRRRGTRHQADSGVGPSPPANDPLAERLHVAVELAEGTGSVLVVYTTHYHPSHYNTPPWNFVPIRPAAVARWIRQAIREGWAPDANGPQYQFRVASPPTGPESEPDAEPDPAA